MSVLLRAAALVLALALGLTWLLLRGASADDATFAAVQSSLDHFTLEQAALGRDVLRARDGLLQTYDPLAAETDAVHQTTRDLRARYAGRPGATASLDRLDRLVARQEDLTEAFKSANAQLQNSLTYFDTLSADAGRSADPAIASLVGELGTAVLHLTRDPSAPTVSQVEQLLAMLDRLSTRAQDGHVREALAVLVRHGRLLTRLLPAMDRGVATLFDLRPGDALDGLRIEAEAWRAGDASVARRFQVALYLIALLLLAVLARAAWRLRAAARALERRAALEHRIAAVSTRFIGCPPDQVGPRLSEALASLGPAFGADRMYLIDVLPDAPGDLVWSSPRTPAVPEGWPARAAGLAPPDGGAWRHDAARLPAGPVRDALHGAGVAGWAGVVLQQGGRRFGVLAMDRAGRTAEWPYGGLGLLRVAADVLAHALQSRAAQQERAELRARLQRAGRLEALGTFASGIAHNFNNIIGAVIGHAEMAADQVGPQTQAASHVHEVQRAGERARALVGQILEFGAGRRARHEPVAIDTLLAETVSMLRPALPPHVALHAASDTSAWVSGDAVQLQQVLANLIRNAAQASGAEGEVHVEAAMAEVANPHPVSHGHLQPGHYVRIEVSDRGIGMDAATQVRIFDPFFTTRPAGTGLGLATVQAVIGDYGGAMDVRSSPGAGSRFAVWLPALPTAADPQEAGRGRGETVLVLGPNRATVLHDEELLAALGFEPVGFSDLAAALDACRRAPTRFDAMLVDGPLHAATALHAASPGCPLIPVRPAGTEPWDAAAPVLHRPLRSGLLAAALSDCLRERGR